MNTVSRSRDLPVSHVTLRKHDLFILLMLCIRKSWHSTLVYDTENYFK